MRSAAILIMVVLAGCASVKPVVQNEKIAVYQHGYAPQNTAKAYQAATAWCSQYGKVAVMDMQTCPTQCTTQFKCE